MAEFKKLFSERVNLSPSWLNVRLNGRSLGDEQMAMLARFLDEKFAEAAPSPAGGEVCANVELAENAIGNAGLIAVLGALERNKVSCKCIKLYKNRIGDEGGTRLAEMVRRQPSALEELHLSHNMLTGRTLIALCMALGKHEGYPLIGRNRLYIPCWLRMEYNHIGRPQDVVDLLRRDGEVPICLAENRDDCGPWRCNQAGRTKQGVPKVHLFTVACQCRRTTTNQDDHELREEFRRWGGRSGPTVSAQRLPLTRAHSGPAATAPGGPGVEQPHPARPKAGPGAGHNGNSRPVWDIHGTGRGPTAAAATNGSAWPATLEECLKQGDEVKDPPGGSPPSTLGNTPPALQRIRTAPAPSLERTETSPTAEDLAGSKVSGVSAGATKAGANQAGASTAVAAAPRAVVPALSAALSATTPAGVGTQVASMQTASGAKPQPPPPTVSPAAAEMPSTAEEAHFAGQPSNKPAMDGSEPRCSLVLDRHGKRRIHPEQLEHGAGSNQQFVCHLCSFVMTNPIMTSCSHLFCQHCFSVWVGEQVSKQRNGQPAKQKAVTTLPCPYPECPAQLEKKDIKPLDAAADTRKGGAALLARLRKSLQVRCVHHRDLYEYSFGSDAAELARARGVTCCWVGDLTSYEEHLNKFCEVEPFARALSGGGATPDERGAATTGQVRAATTGVDVAQSQAAAGNVQEAGAGSTQQLAATVADAADSNAENTGVAQSDTAIADGGEVRIAQYDYTPKETDRTQLTLVKDDLVLVYQVTESGWAAGTRLNKSTKELVGEAGWFPAAYLATPGVHAAAEAA